MNIGVNHVVYRMAIYQLMRYLFKIVPDEYKDNRFYSFGYKVPSFCTITNYSGYKLPYFKELIANPNIDEDLDAEFYSFYRYNYHKRLTIINEVISNTMTEFVNKKYDPKSNYGRLQLYIKMLNHFYNGSGYFCDLVPSFTGYRFDYRHYVGNNLYYGEETIMLPELESTANKYGRRMHNDSMAYRAFWGNHAQREFWLAVSIAKMINFDINTFLNLEDYAKGLVS